MTFRALVIAMLGFSGLFAMQGCGGSPPATTAPVATTAEAAETTDEPETAPAEATTASP
jgi:hypothetical protein